MYVKVIKPYKDKNLKKIFYTGSIIEMSEERAAQINAARFGPHVDPVIEPKANEADQQEGTEKKRGRPAKPKEE